MLTCTASTTALRHTAPHSLADHAVSCGLPAWHIAFLAAAHSARTHPVDPALSDHSIVAMMVPLGVLARGRTAKAVRYTWDIEALQRQEVHQTFFGLLQQPCAALVTHLQQWGPNITAAGVEACAAQLSASVVQAAHGAVASAALAVAAVLLGSRRSTANR